MGVMKSRLALPGWESTRGDKSRAAKLTEDMVRTIKQRLANGEEHLAIAEDYAVTRACISKISAKRSWCHVKLEPEDASNE